MKQYLLALLMLLTLNANAAGVQPRHRHHPRTEQVDTTAAQKQAGGTTAINDNYGGQDSTGIEAYSDTTDVDSAMADDFYDDDSSDSENDLDRLFDSVSNGSSFLRGVIAFFICLCLLVFVLSPIAIVALIIYFMLKRRQQNMEMTMHAMQNGEPNPQPVSPSPDMQDKYYLNRGIRNTAIGVGLFLMFAVWDSEILMGIGLLVACIGIGQIVIAKINKK